MRRLILGHVRVILHILRGNIAAVILRRNDEESPRDNQDLSAKLYPTQTEINIMSPKKRPFWEEKSLLEMTEKEWESLCDGCAQCCLHKIEDDDTGEIFYTYVACRKLDIDQCRCISYQERFHHVPDCLKIEPKGFSRMHLLPETCAYRRLSNGKSLKWWHPLISKDPNSIHQANISIKHKAISEENVHPDDIPDCILFQLD